MPPVRAFRAHLQNFAGAPVALRLLEESIKVVAGRRGVRRVPRPLVVVVQAAQVRERRHLSLVVRLAQHGAPEWRVFVQREVRAARSRGFDVRET